MARWIPLGLLLLVACRPPLGDTCGNGIDDPGEVCLERARVVEAGIDPCDLAVGDVTGDGIVDVVVPNSDPSEDATYYLTSVLRGDLDAPLGVRERFNIGHAIPYRAAIARLADAELPQIIVGGEATSIDNSLVLSTSSPPGSWEVEGSFGTKDTIGYLTAIDDPFGDGSTLLALTSNGLEVHPDATIGSTPTDTQPIAGGTDVAACRFGGPGSAPKIVVGTASGRILVFSLDAAGELSLDHETDVFQGTKVILALECADFEGDGHEDILLSAAPVPYFRGRDPVRGQLMRIASDGETVRRVADLEGPESPFDLAVADINDDGVDDYAVIDPYAERLGLWTSVPGGAHTQLAGWDTETWPARVVFGDVDADGQQDLVVANQLANSVLVVDSNP